MARSLAGTLATVAVITPALLPRDWLVGAQSGIAGFIPQSLEDRSALEVGLCAALAVFGFALVCWAFLQLPGEIFLVGMGLELAWVVVWLCFGGDIVRTVEFLVSDTVRWSACIVAAALILGTLWLLSVVRRRELIDTGALVSMALVFPVVVVSLGVSLVWTGTIWDWPSLMEGIYILGAAAVPFIPLATVSLAIAKRRHR